MSAEVLAELDQVIALLEARIPANIDSPANQKLAKAMQKDIAEYFRQMEMALPDLTELYYRNVRE